MQQRATLYAIPASHPCATAERALELKRIRYRRIDLMPGAHIALQRVRFGRPTVPGLRFEDGTKAAGSRQIVHLVDERSPDPPLFPADPRRRSEVEEAERWGDEVLQDCARRVEIEAIARSPWRVMVPHAAGTRPPVPTLAVRLSRPLSAWASRRRYGVSPSQFERDLADLPGHLDRVDAFIADGVMGGDEPNAADLQIAPSIRVLAALEDLAPVLENRPCAELAMRLFPEWPTVPSGVIAQLQ